MARKLNAAIHLLKQTLEAHVFRASSVRVANERRWHNFVTAP